MCGPESKLTYVFSQHGYTDQNFRVSKVADFTDSILEAISSMSPGANVEDDIEGIEDHPEDTTPKPSALVPEDEEPGVVATTRPDILDIYEPEPDPIDRIIDMVST